MTYTAHIDTFARDHLPPREQWPDLLFELPELQYPERFNCAVELLDRNVVRGNGARTAIIGADGSAWTYAELLDRVNQITHVLREDMGLVPGNRVLLRGANSPMYAACWLAVAKAGMIAVGTMPLLRAKELTDMIAKAEVGAALCDLRLIDELRIAQEQCPVLKTVVTYYDASPAGLEARMRGRSTDCIAAPTAGEDTCMIAFTSGTTGKPKGTMHFHRDILAAADCFPRSIVKTLPDDRFIGSPPLAFTFGLGGLLLFPLRVGASTVLIERAAPEAFLALIERHRASVLFTAPTSYRAMAMQLAGSGPRPDLSSLRKCVSAGEALPAGTRKLWRDATGIEIIDGIGSTEFLHMFISHTEAEARSGATGKPIPGYQARVVDDAGNPVPPGQVGRLAVKGPTGCRYLADDRQRTYVQNGWNYTGDAYSIDDDGYFVYQARTDDMIISAGYNIAGPEVESALLMHMAVAECGVVGVADEARGQVVTAFVVLKPGHDGDAEMVKELQEFVKQIIAPYKYPRAIRFVATLPRTETGKLQRFRLRQLGAMSVERTAFEALDRADPLAPLREQFLLPQGVIYLDGNSLGALPRTTPGRVARVVEQEWGGDLITSWNRHGWMQSPQRLGDKIARLVGAGPGEVVVAESTSINLFKVLAVALKMRPGRRVIVSEAENFPTDLYMAEGLADLLGQGHALRLVEADQLNHALDAEAAVLMLTHVNFRTGAMHDMAALTRAAHAAGALAIWDLAHSAGAVPVDLNGAAADFAVGCGYKYLNGGPGAPAFVYAAARHQGGVAQPLYGWLGHASAFDFAPDYRPAAGIRQYIVSSPSIIAMAALEEGVDLMLQADPAALRAKSLALTGAFIDLVEARCAGQGLALATTRDPARRGSQVSFAHAGAYAVMQALIARGVIGDFRAPDLLRFGFTPLYVRHVDVWDAVEILREVLSSGAWRRPEFQARAEVT